ncbi:MAG: CpaF family protein [Moorellaceae bacterium]
MAAQSLAAKLLYSEQTCLTNDEVEELRARVLARARRENPKALKDPRNHEGYLRGIAMMERGATPALVDSVVSDMLGYGPLQRYIFPTEERYRNVTEVMVPVYDKVYVEINGSLQKTETRFRDEEHLRAVAEKIVMSCGRRVNESEPVVDAKLPDGSRVNVIIPPIARGGTTMVIRRFPRPIALEDLINNDAITEELVAYLREVIARGLNVVVTGPMGSGKTTILNALLSLVTETWGTDASVIIFEDIAELQPQHENVRCFESRPPGLDGQGEVSIVSLAQTAMLRLRPDWIILGECRGAEAYYVLQAMCVGHPAMTTFHAIDAVDAVMGRLPAMVIMSREGQVEGRAAALDRIAGAVDVVLHATKVIKGNYRERRIVQVAEVMIRETPAGRVPDPRTIFRFDGKKLSQVADPRIFNKKKVVF